MHGTHTSAEHFHHTALSSQNHIPTPTKCVPRYASVNLQHGHGREIGVPHGPWHTWVCRRCSLHGVTARRYGPPQGSGGRMHRHSRWEGTWTCHAMSRASIIEHVHVRSPTWGWGGTPREWWVGGLEPRQTKPNRENRLTVITRRASHVHPLRPAIRRTSGCQQQPAPAGRY